MSNYHKTTIGEAVETLSEAEKNTMYYIIGCILEDEVKTYEDYKKLLSKMSKPNDYIVNTLVHAASVGNSFPNERLNHDMEAWSACFLSSHEPCLFLVAEQETS